MEYKEHCRDKILSVLQQLIYSFKKPNTEVWCVSEYIWRNNYLIFFAYIMSFPWQMHFFDKKIMPKKSLNDFRLKKKMFERSINCFSVEICHNAWGEEKGFPGRSFPEGVTAQLRRQEMEACYRWIKERQLLTEALTKHNLQSLGCHVCLGPKPDLMKHHLRPLRKEAILNSWEEMK